MSGSDPVEVTVPGDKSISHRALILPALAEGQSRIAGLLDSADIRSTASALEALGVEIRTDRPSTVVTGVGLRRLRSPDAALDCGNSGTTARLLLGALAGSHAEAVLTGDASLRGRPMRRVTGPLEACGARFDELGEPDRLPIRIRGTRALQPIDMGNTRSSAQVKTAMLLAGLTAGVEVRVAESGRPRDHTERMLAAMGADVRSAPGADGDVVRLDPPARLDPLELTVPGDISSAAFFLALGALRHPVRVRGVGLNPTRTGALDVMERMGAEIGRDPMSDRAGEPVGDVVAGPGPLRGTTVQEHEIPTLLDEVPVLAVLAACADGETRFRGVAELRVKETDRIEALVRNLRALGVETDDGPDHLTIVGRAGPLSGHVDAFGDHRIAMAFGVLGARPGNEIRIRSAEAVEISYPGFWNELRRVNQEMEAA
ncbi:MAG: 3-phosphoshikimate 1-carboxyvinyltransferase [Candidatus Longimicrobiales bacterium M2_2A_002]